MPDSQDNSTNTPQLKQINKSPAFQFYPKDFLTDINVISMSLEERGAYITLLCYDWLEDGLTEAQIDKTLKDFKGGCPLVKDRFTPHPIREGFFTNPRLLKERQKQRSWIIKSQQGGLKSAEVRKKKALSNSSRLKGGSQMVETIEQPKVNSSSSSTFTSTSTNINKSALTSDDFVFPEKLNSILHKKALDEFIQHRKELKKPLTKTAINKLLIKYANEPNDFLTNLNHSMANGWQGVHAPNMPNQAKGKSVDPRINVILNSLGEQND